MARYDRVIPPGGEGGITLQVKTKGYQGSMRKGAKVYSNDPKRRLEEVMVNVFVKVPISINPRYVYFRGIAGQKITKSVKIKAEREKPLELEPNRFNLSNRLTYRLEEVELGRLFEVHFTTISDQTGSFKGALYLKTNYPEKPELPIQIRGRIIRKPPEVKDKGQGPDKGKALNKGKVGDKGKVDEKGKVPDKGKALDKGEDKKS